MRLDRCPSCKRRLTRSNAQSRRYWALLHALADNLHPRGQTFSADTWHLWSKSRYLGCTDYVLPSGKTMAIPISTATLDVEQFSTYMDKIEAWANDHGVFLEDMENAA